MNRPPAVSMLFFLAVPVVLASMWFSVRELEAPLNSHREPAPSASREDRIRTFANSWPQEPDYAPLFNALDPALDVSDTAPSAFDPTDDYFGLPRQGEYELVYGYCSACHSLRIVMQQHATRTRWVELLAWMQEKQGMAEPPPEDKAAIVDYLAAHFGAEN